MAPGRFIFSAFDYYTALVLMSCRKTGRIGDCCVTHDIILGHESAGQVIQKGTNVRNLVVGDKMSVEPGVSCWECDICLRGRYNLCPKVK